ncbi:MAG: hypothetical protein RLZZ618_1790 [Pseudomonadota bacterium]|jgi:putative colanic acid biosynthesis UDP-glucose lipid carrier transferase
MFQSSGNVRQFINAPPTVAGFISTFLEPGIAILSYVVVSHFYGQALDRASVTLCLLVFALTFPGVNRFYQRPLTAASDLLGSWAMLLGILGLCGYATDSFQFFEREVLIVWATTTVILYLIAVLSGGAWIRHFSGLAHRRRSAIIVGGGPLCRKLTSSLGHGRGIGVDVQGYFDDRSHERLESPPGQTHLGSLSRLREYVIAHSIKEVYITLPMSSQPRIVRLLADLQDTTASLYFVPDVFGISIIQGRLADVNGVPVVGLLETPFTGSNRLFKRLSDIALSSLILLLISPILAVISVAVKLTSSGPVIFKQRRNGLDGEEITVYKFRSMRTMDDGAVVRQATRGDPRITRLGAFLRKTSLDELPQFINVLQGRMSIVGPRPHAVAHNQQFRGMIKAYMVRHKVKPGITGWAQVNGHRGETDTIEKMQARVEFDLEYLRNWSLGFDLQIIARTIKLVLLDRNAY